MTSNISDIHFLVVEDDPSMLRVLKVALEKKGARVTTATNGKEAWELFLSLPIDIILSDVQMPVMSGTELLAKVRAKDKDKPVFLLVTGQAQLDEEKAKALGAAGLFHKPFRLSDFISRLESILNCKSFSKISA